MSDPNLRFVWHDIYMLGMCLNKKTLVLSVYPNIYRRLQNKPIFIYICIYLYQILKENTLFVFQVFEGIVLPQICRKGLNIFSNKMSQVSMECSKALSGQKLLHFLRRIFPHTHTHRNNVFFYQDLLGEHCRQTFT